MTAPARVDQVIDGATYSVDLAIDPARVLPALLRALADWPMTAADFVHATPGRARDRALALLAADPDISDALTLTLNPHDADRLANDLTQAAVEPDLCPRHDGDGTYAVHDGLCREDA